MQDKNAGLSRRILFPVALLEKECAAVKSARLAKDFPLCEPPGFAASTALQKHCHINW